MKRTSSKPVNRCSRLVTAILPKEETKPVDSGTVVGEMESTEAIIPEAAVGLAPGSTTVKATPVVRALANRHGSRVVDGNP